MSDSFPVLLLVLLAGVGLIVGAFCFVKSMARLETGFLLLILMVMLGGIVGVDAGSGVYPVVFRDIFIVLPLYVGVFARKSGQDELLRIPGEIIFVLVLLILDVVLGTLNPNSVSFIQILVALKVWLFYMPFLGVGMVIAGRPSLTTRILRLVLFWGMIPCAVGLLQSLLVRVVGYETAIGWFFGDNAIKVTQGFAFFEEAGGIYRIPSTFSFVGQYGQFLYVYLTVAVTVINTDPKAQVRTVARFALMAAIVAAIFCGSRSAILVVPLLVAGYMACGLLKFRTLLLAPLGIVAGAIALSFSDLNLLEYFSFGDQLATNYANDFIGQQIADGLRYGFFGGGLGIATNAARHVVSSFADLGYVGFESYFAKAAAELGWLGFVIVCLLFLTILVRTWRVFSFNRYSERNAVIAPLAIYIFYTVVMSFKAGILDTDPSNIFFWLFLGMLIGAGKVRAATSGDTDIFHLAELEIGQTLPAA
ncbi:MAG: hypothetical protein JWM91_2720 [Rhodospirillales bacterium]|nr:hypothetical protein [Rhodospirillales bacterium]